MSEMMRVDAMRSARKDIGASERYLLEERARYQDLRERADAALVLAGNRSEGDREAHNAVVRQRMALLLGDLEAAETPEDRGKIAESLRSLADQVEDRGFDISRSSRVVAAEAGDQMQEAEALLREVSVSRWALIEQCRQAIDISLDPEAVEECLALLNEEITLCLALKNADGAARGTAALAEVRRQVGESRQEEKRKAAEQAEKEEIAESIASDLVTRHTISVGDARWFATAILRHLHDGTSENAWRAASHAAIAEYREIGRQTVGGRKAEDPKREFVGDALRF